MAKNRVPTRTILTVEGDDSIRALIGQTLRKEGYRVIEAPDGPSALRLVREHRPSLIILDSALPGMDAFELCSHLRGMPFVTRALILFVSADETATRIAQALDAGGDDYLRKPFAARELRARVEALLRRSPSTEMPRGVPALRLDPHRHTVTVAGRQVMLTPTEYQLLEYLCQHPEDYHAAPALLEKIWQYPPGTGDTALVRNHVRNLRRKIEANPDLPEIVVSLHGRGYSVRAHLM
ncbi:MAG: response regulator transcription factor [Anaerolineae bacterium]|nr:response regulator transcription factor [Anaerolineae bacterium]